MTPYLLTYVTGDARAKYSANRARCIKSFLDNGFEGKVFAGSDVNRPEWPKIRYAFKAYAIREAISHGARFVIWADSPMVLLKPYSELEGWIRHYGVLLPKTGYGNIFWSVGQWANDATLEYFKISRQEAFEIPTCISGFMGFDVHSDLAKKVINEFFAACNVAELMDGPRYTNEPVEVGRRAQLDCRSDQCVMSILAHKYEIPLIERIFADIDNGCGFEKKMELTEKSLVGWYLKGEPK